MGYGEQEREVMTTIGHEIPVRHAAIVETADRFEAALATLETAKRK